jgi:hypothetical protein
VNVLLSKEYSGDRPCLVTTMQRWNGSYGYRTACVPDTIAAGVWTTLQMDYLTPPVRK